MGPSEGHKRCWRQPARVVQEATNKLVIVERNHRELLASGRIMSKGPRWGSDEQLESGGARCPNEAIAVTSRRRHSSSLTQLIELNLKMDRQRRLASESSSNLSQVIHIWRRAMNPKKPSTRSRHSAACKENRYATSFQARQCRARRPLTTGRAIFSLSGDRFNTSAGNKLPPVAILILELAALALAGKFPACWSVGPPQWASRRLASWVQSVQV